MVPQPWAPARRTPAPGTGPASCVPHRRRSLPTAPSALPPLPDRAPVRNASKKRPPPVTPYRPPGHRPRRPPTRLPPQAPPAAVAPPHTTLPHRLHHHGGSQHLSSLSPTARECGIHARQPSECTPPTSIRHDHDVHGRDRGRGSRRRSRGGGGRSGRSHDRNGRLHPREGCAPGRPEKHHCVVVRTLLGQAGGAAGWVGWGA
jgi:hypothetical protein